MFRHSWLAASAVVALAATLTLGCARPIDLVNHDSPDSELAALVDSDAARRLLADVLARRSADARLAAAAGAAHLTELASSEPQLGGVGVDVRLPDQALLKKLADKTSMDFAALVFARTLAAEPRSRAVQAAFDRFLREGSERSADALRRPRAFPYTLLFAPSWLYKSHPENGSDFANQRRILEALGVRNHLIESGESDSVEDNAAVIVRAIRETGCEDGPIVVVSASKSGAEAALALSGLTPDEAACVAAWINIAGALRGTPLADSALRVPVRWLARGIFFLSGWSWDALESLETERSRHRLETLRLPETITVLNVVAVPVSGSVKFAWLLDRSWPTAAPDGANSHSSTLVLAPGSDENPPVLASANEMIWPACPDSVKRSTWPRAVIWPEPSVPHVSGTAPGLAGIRHSRFRL